MTTYTQPRAAESNARPTVGQAPHEYRSAASEDQCRKGEADRQFEAAIERFLAVSRAA
jgi:hypothetical protein